RKFELCADSSVPILAGHRQHMGPPVHDPFPQGRSCIEKPDETFPIKGTEHEAADVRVGDEIPRGHDVDVGGSPCLALKFNTLLELGNFGKRADGHGARISDLAFCQSCSISSREVWSNVLPCLASSPSMY